MTCWSSGTTTAAVRVVNVLLSAACVCPLADNQAAAPRRRLLQSAGGSAPGLLVQVYQNVQLDNVTLPETAKLSFTKSAALFNYSDIATNSGLMTLAGQTTNFTLRFSGASLLCLQPLAKVLAASGCVQNYDRSGRHS